MRVLLLADSLGNGGLERQLSLLATSLPPDWEPRVLAIMGAAGRAQILAELAVDAMVERTLAVYAEAVRLAGGRRPAS